MRRKLHLNTLPHFSLTKPCKNFSAANPNQGFQLIHVRKNLKERDLCPYTAIYHYLKLTAYKRSSTSLFVSSLLPFAAAKSGILLNWVKQLMEQAGVDTRVFKPHSTRAAATSYICHWPSSRHDFRMGSLDICRFLC